MAGECLTEGVSQSLATCVSALKEYIGLEILERNPYITYLLTKAVVAVELMDHCVMFLY